MIESWVTPNKVLTLFCAFQCVKHGIMLTIVDKVGQTTFHYWQGVISYYWRIFNPKVKVLGVKLCKCKAHATFRTLWVLSRLMSATIFAVLIGFFFYTEALILKFIMIYETFRRYWPTNMEFFRSFLKPAFCIFLLASCQSVLALCRQRRQTQIEWLSSFYYGRGRWPL